MDIIQIVGYKNSGKTALSTKVIEYFVGKGLRTASLKHHGHGGVPEGIKNTDSEKHKQAGALLSGVEGDGLLQLTKENWEVNEIIAIYRLIQVDVLVIEGFKKHPFPKVVLINKVEDLELLEKVENIKAIFSHLPLTGNTYPYPVFHASEISKFYKWLEDEIIVK